jgi:hypothetical protein
MLLQDSSPTLPPPPPPKTSLSCDLKLLAIQSKSQRNNLHSATTDMYPALRCCVLLCAGVQAMYTCQLVWLKPHKTAYNQPTSHAPCTTHLLRA